MAAELEDSNVAGLGGEEDRALRKSAAESEPEWEGAGTEPGIQVWRVENEKAKVSGLKADFGVKRLHDEDEGTFYDGDSYIVLVTRKKLDEEGAETDALEWDAHFWLGQDSTQDEMGVAAYKTVELDCLLDDGAVQYRQVQNGETEAFLKLFDPPGICVLDGGIDGGFTHVEDPADFTPRLMRITKTGRGAARVYQVPAVVDSLCQHDCFVLDLGLKLYPFVGTSASPWEQRKMRDFMNKTDDDRKGQAEKMPDNDDEFYAFFEVDSSVELPETALEVAELEPTDPVLYRLSLDGGSDDGFSKVEGEIAPGSLVSEDAYIIDTGDAIYAWVGSKANFKEKSEIMVQAMDYVAREGRPKTIPICRLFEGQCVPGFEQYLG